MVDNRTWADKIRALKEQKNAVILAHYYTRPEVQQVADFVGDSLALSQQAADTDADIIQFAGVHFMAETAKVLSPDKKVLIPDPEAGCSLADSCDAEAFRRFLEAHPDHIVVTYVNTSVEVKAMTDICCTSSNAVKVIRSLPADRKIIFAPDRNLGDYIKRVTGRNDIVLWDGACHVHENFSLEKLLALKKEHPGAKVLAHPECKKPVLMAADFVGSTAAIIDFVGTDGGREYLIATESGILFELREKYPDVNFIPVPPIDSTCGCNDCQYMKLVTLEKICRALETETPEVVIDEEIRRRAERSIRNMLALK
ncbi:MAG TPA: quinolinate synthase NadA [Candidatus Tidjanibacter faecipullorum]|uniref:Quinolinate synthase n=1 Tax=Candidatus Tidjanibacter faecipullorum TaxID=2838766 RepID=A0A9D2DE59_9BACT|nr:quinolinate synthase NadA [Candidatus Tidjanibacter faecipullorum]